VSAGNAHTCALGTDERIVCWGARKWGKFPPSGEFVQLASGGEHTCAVRKDGTVACIGQCAHGECTPPPGLFVQVTAAGHTTCGLMINGSATCWGMNVGSPHGFNLPPKNVQFTQISLATSRTLCGITVNSSLVCWGAIVAHPDAGQLYIRDGAYAMVSSGQYLFCGLRADSRLSCDGNVFHLRRDAPHIPSKDMQWAEVTTRHSTICGIELAEPHLVRCWGSQLADAAPPELRAAV
jgi:hypothetical protein